MNAVHSGAPTQAPAGTPAMTMPEPLARFVGVDKSYDGETLVVKNLDLDVRRGEFLTLLGPSGSGKTTCLMMLAGFEAPTRGDIMLDGKVINQMPPYLRDIGVVFQNYALFPHMTVAENIGFPLFVRRRPKQEIAQRVQAALELVKLSGFGSRRPSQLSGGQQQRVALARALVFEPKLILLDEPLGALDKQLREQLQYELKALHRRLQVTMVYVTHDQAEALTMSDRVAVFNRGRIEQIASGKALYEQPRNAFVAQFVGENNRLLGRVLSVERERCRVALDNGGGEVTATAGDGVTSGDAASVFVRPERLRLDPASPAANMFDAVVEDLTYLGDQIRVTLRCCGRDDVIAKLPNLTGLPAAAPGDRIRVGWRTEDCHAFPTSEG